MARDPMDLEAQVAAKMYGTQAKKPRPPKTLPMLPMPKRPKTPGMTRRNRGPF